MLAIIQSCRESSVTKESVEQQCVCVWIFNLFVLHFSLISVQLSCAFHAVWLLHTATRLTFKLRPLQQHFAFCSLCSPHNSIFNSSASTFADPEIKLETSQLSNLLALANQMETTQTSNLHHKNRNLEKHSSQCWYSLLQLLSINYLQRKLSISDGQQ